MALAENPKATWNYELLERYEAGIELFGFEVKSVRKGQASLTGARIVVRGGEAYLVGATIAPYQQNNSPKDYDPSRTRRLLLGKNEIKGLQGTESTKGLTLVPISLYNKSRVIKLSFAVARGKKRFDKRETIKKREIEREMRREMKEP